MLRNHPILAPPTDDKRWKIVETVMRRNNFQPQALIESLHSVQQTFGFLDLAAMRWVAATLRVPLAKVYGVATFYHFFTLRPPGRHTCVVCLGTACYIKGSQRLLAARCIGACGLAPTAVVDGQVLGQRTPTELTAAVGAVLEGRAAP
ncbi:MAG: NAD(P)H-dependent oxidoreductase subunit E [Planctomycetes bacterium]|nr:NAD(P)H-dependent oxidoreductase subunit E [Planctomycetota bacterium]